MNDFKNEISTICRFLLPMLNKTHNGEVITELGPHFIPTIREKVTSENQEFNGTDL
jgi:hypothetical protein